MATPTKTADTLQASASNAAGATTTGTGLDLLTKFGGTATVRITNGGTAPTVGCRGRLEVSKDNSDFLLFREYLGDTTANSVNEWSEDLPYGGMYLRAKFTGNTAQAVTVQADFQEVTSIA